ncbi:phosphoadenosine phosphosulfate reductase [Lactobacillus colini]|uniref:Phosphoadenosine phosphosulfate reductase n=1 Tax=Lactobacillus colini TaxID=1819254 RepID=A0ABS4MH10_9LACO|nr:phosphoadenosine phosphosulfate reductase family protein [Lactobacillus colini]MBP2058606.1 phosphoadenosine phosphosulfate reductase [Lactobacillus colini]
MSLLDAIKTQSQITDSVIVSFSMGKDSIVTLDLCMRYFKHVGAFFMYLVPGLEFQENTLKKYEKYYGIEILRVPHFENSNFYRYGSFRDPDFTVPLVKINDIYAYVRKQTGVEWIAGGEKIADSIVRLSMLKHSGSVDVKRRRFYPVMYWHDKEIKEYIKYHRLLYPEFNRKLGFSFHSLAGKELAAIKDIYPKDYQRILKFFPEAQAGVLQYEMNKKSGEK